MRIVVRLLLISALAVHLSCSTSGRNKGDFNFYSASDDAQIGAYWANYVQTRMPILYDERVNDYVSALGQKIVAKFSNEQIFNYQFRIINDPEVNAFALPGGYIYLNLGLLQVVKNEAELASILGHEMGHVVNRHGTEQLTKSHGITCCLALGASVLGLSSTDVDIVSLFGHSGALYFGRAAEFEADQFGIEALYKANYNIHSSVQLFQTLRKIHKGRPGLLGKLLSTHPPVKDRIKNVELEIKNYGKQKKPIITSEAFQQMKENLKKYPNKYDF